MNDLVELHLRSGSPAATEDTTGWKGLVLNILRILSDVAPDGQSPDTAAVAAKLLEHRRALGGNLHPQEERKEAAACVRTCEKYLRRIQLDQNARETELTEMIALLREATSRLIGDSSNFREEVQSSADRFKQMTKLDDLRELKRELSSEVSQLQRAVEEKRQRDEEAIARLSKRVEVLQTDLQMAEEKASVDPLTHVANRGGFDRAIVRMMDTARRNQTPLCLALFDLDHFKHLNDTHGHPVGDRVLLCTAERLRGAVRATDFVARYGGEEFAVLLADVTLAQAEPRLRQMLDLLAGFTFEYDDEAGAQSVRFTASCGVAQFVDGDDDKALTKRADQALYDAKQQGRNRVVARKTSRLARFFSGK